MNEGHSIVNVRQWPSTEAIVLGTPDETCKWSKWSKLTTTNTANMTKPSNPNTNKHTNLPNRSNISNRINREIALGPPRSVEL